MDFFTAFLGFMSILTGSVPYFPLASGEFWTFSCFFCALCPFSPAQLHISLWLPDDFGLFYAFSLFYIHMEEYRSLQTAKSTEVSNLRRVQKSPDYEEFGILRTAKSCTDSDKKVSYHLPGKRNSYVRITVTFPESGIRNARSPPFCSKNCFSDCHKQNRQNVGNILCRATIGNQKIIDRMKRDGGP